MKVLARWLGRFAENRIYREGLGVIGDVQVNGWYLEVCVS